MEFIKKNCQIGFGGGCHWCTEAVFQSLHGVEHVDQGWISSFGEHNTFSEAVIVHYNPEIITTKTLIEIHLLTHSSTSKHSMRIKYRSAIYTYSHTQIKECKAILNSIRKENGEVIITEVLPFNSFKRNAQNFLNYYKNKPEAPFCKTNIEPKLQKLKANFKKNLKTDQ